MHFIKSADSSLGQKDLLGTLNSSLIRGRVLWLLTGGSNIQITVSILDKLDDSLTSKLYILLADERYGISGHQDSNYTKLVNAGMSLKQATFPDVLADSLGLRETTEKYAETFKRFKDKSDVVIAQLGIGEDGHIAGVLPGSPELNSNDTIIEYQADDFKRLSLSLNTLKEIDKTFVFCYGASKRSALKRLASGKESLESLPSLILKQMPDVKVYNDLIEEGQ